jgi:hypothetical protein
MLVAILSDSHDHILNLRLAISAANAANASLLLHCGDLISPFMLPELARFHGEVHLIYGNNTGDQHLISQRCGSRFPKIFHHGILGLDEAEGRQLAFTHYPELAEGLAAQGEFDLVCCGHDHTYRHKRIGPTLLINPGELLGKDEQPGLCVIDLTTLQVQRIEVGAMMCTPRNENKGKDGMMP